MANPIGRIGEACHKLSTTRLPLRVSPTNQAQIEALASMLSPVKAFGIRRLLSPLFSDWIADHLLTADQSNGILPILHNTANPVIIQPDTLHRLGHD